jgi:hypothetical protein
MVERAGTRKQRTSAVQYGFEGWARRCNVIMISIKGGKAAFIWDVAFLFPQA